MHSFVPHTRSIYYIGFVPRTYSFYLQIIIIFETWHRAGGSNFRERGSVVVLKLSPMPCLKNMSFASRRPYLGLQYSISSSKFVTNQRFVGGSGSSALFDHYLRHNRMSTSAATVSAK
jgi:hypothetical protein